jgi:hypothetical protein
VAVHAAAPEAPLGLGRLQKAAFFHALDEETRDAYCRQAGVPFLARHVLLPPAIAKHDRKNARLLREIVEDTGADRKRGLSGLLVKISST